MVNQLGPEEELRLTARRQRSVVFGHSPIPCVESKGLTLTMRPMCIQAVARPERMHPNARARCLICAAGCRSFQPEVCTLRNRPSTQSLFRSRMFCLFRPAFGRFFLLEGLPHCILPRTFQLESVRLGTGSGLRLHWLLSLCLCLFHFSIRSSGTKCSASPSNAAIIHLTVALDAAFLRRAISRAVTPALPPFS